MPRRKKTVTTVEEVPIVEKDSVPTSQPDDALALNERDALAALMQELSGVSSARVTVYRATRNQPQAYMFACSPEAFSLDDLRDKYNGGEFRIYISRDGKPWKNMRVTVEPKVQSAQPEAPSPIAELASAMRDGFAQQAELLREALTARPATPGVDINGLLQTLPSLLQSLRTLTAPPPTEAAPESKAIDMLLKGFELAKELRSEASDDGGLLSVVRDVLKSPLLAQAVAASSASIPSTPAPIRTTVAAPVAQPVSVPPIAPAAPTPNVTQPTGVDMQAMRRYLALLCEKAAAGSDPTLYADLILDNAPEFVIRAVLNRQPSAIDALIADYPPVAQYREFFEELIAALREALDAPAGSVLQGDADVSTHTYAPGNGTAPVSRDTSTG